jgi:hypothetical protein
VFVLAGSAPAFALAFLFGLAAALSRRRGLVAGYAWTSVLVLLMSMALGALVLLGYTHPTLASADGQPARRAGPAAMLSDTEGQALTGALVVFWFVQLCAYLLTSIS